MLGLLYEGRHLSLSIRRKVTANIFYSTFFIFVTFLTFFDVFLFLGKVFFIYAFNRFATIPACDRRTDRRSVTEPYHAPR